MKNDHQPADPLVAPRRSPAKAMNGQTIEPSELEAAAELSRLARRLGLAQRGVDGFRLLAIYRRSIRALEALLGWSRRH